jgi:outer membrane biosynthesis protein TonB
MFMTTKFLALIAVIGLATICVAQGQSTTPAESPAESPSPAEKAASPPPAEKAASPSPTESPTASPKAKPTPKKAKAETKARPAATPAPPARSAEEAANPPAPGGGHGQVWVNTETGVYHREGSRFYGTTRKGKYMTEQDAIQGGFKPAPKSH